MAFFCLAIFGVFGQVQNDERLGDSSSFPSSDGLGVVRPLSSNSIQVWLVTMASVHDVALPNRWRGYVTGWIMALRRQPEKVEDRVREIAIS